MASLKETGMGIGDFAQALLEQDKTNPQPVSKPKSQGNVPDIENVQVLQEDVDAVLSNSFGVDKPKKEAPKVNLEEQRVKQLREDIKVKVAELKALLAQLPLDEVTGVGSIGMGVSNAGPNRAYKATTRRRKSRRKDLR